MLREELLLAGRHKKTEEPVNPTIRLVRVAIVIMLLTAACARPPATLTTGSMSGGEIHEDEVTAVIIAALNGEATGEAADSLYTSSAVIVVNGRTRTLSPLFAGIGAGGQVAITSSQMEIRTGIGWGLVDYRWETRDGVAREGRATFVLTRTGSGGWQIQHAHSSSPR